MTRPSEPMAPVDTVADAVLSPFTIELGTEVLAEIRQSALAAFRSLPYGGLEIGGVLFGRAWPSEQGPQKVEVMATRPIDCDHAAGPAFILSSAERLRIPHLSDPTAQEESLPVVGFWVSHGRSELGLTAHDADLYRDSFPQPWQIALILKPESHRPLREALFCRTDGEVFPYKPPVVEQETTDDADLLPAGPRLRSYWEPPAPEVVPEPPAPQPEVRVREMVKTLPSRSLRMDKQSFGLWSGITLMLFGLLVGSGLTYLLFGNHQPVAAKATPPQLALEMFLSGKDVLIHWDAKSPVVRDARVAELRIHDGRMVQTLILSPEVLSRGHCHYQPTSSDVRTALIVTENDGRTEQSIASRFSE